MTTFNRAEQQRRRKITARLADERAHTDRLRRLQALCTRLRADRFNVDALRDFETLVHEMTQHERVELRDVLADMLRGATRRAEE